MVLRIVVSCHALDYSAFSLRDSNPLWSDIWSNNSPGHRAPWVYDGLSFFDAMVEFDPLLLPRRENIFVSFTSAASSAHDISCSFSSAIRSDGCSHRTHDGERD